MKVGDLIRKLRKERKLTQEQLAKKLNVAPTAVSAWERHENRPLIDKIVVMSELFEVPMDYFFKEFAQGSRPSSEREPDAILLEKIKKIADKHDMDLNDPSTLELIDSAFNLVKRLKKQ